MDSIDHNSQPPRRSGPLAGMLVLDFGQAAVGPVATEYLGMLGATVIKLENPKGDTVRFGVPTMKGTSTTFLPRSSSRTGLSLILTPKDRMDCLGSMKVRPT